jgi:hypothetical protein
MITALMAKAGTYVAIFAIGGLLSLMVEHKLFTNKPDNIDYKQIRAMVAEEIKSIPAPTVSVQPFDVEKIKGLKQFNYAPQFTGSVSVAGVDSTALRKMIDASVDRSIKKNVKQKFLK